MWVDHSITPPCEVRTTFEYDPVLGMGSECLCIRDLIPSQIPLPDREVKRPTVLRDTAGVVSERGGC